MDAAPAGERGHRTLDHTADVIVEAWGPTLASCLEEAVAAVVEGFVDVAEVPASDTVPVSIDRGSHEDLLVDLLEEVVYLLDVLGVVPVGVRLEEAEDGGLAGTFEVVQAGRLEGVGAVPKAVARSGLVVEREADGHWRARATVDV